MGWIYVSWFMVTSVGISDKLGKWFGLTASCRDRVYVRVRGERSRQGTGGGRMLEATPSAGFREASVECAGGGRGNDASERWTGGHNVHVHSLLCSCSMPTRLGGNPPPPPRIAAPWRRRFGCWIFPPVVLWLYRNCWHALYCQARLDGITDADVCITRNRI